MRFSECYGRHTRPVISFEVFPPKTEAGMAGLRRVLAELVDLRPDFITVTYGALGSTRERTLEIASLVKREFGMEAACHLTCVGSSRANLDRMLLDIRRAGIENIVALRGDPPKGETAFTPPPDGYAHANELVAHIRRFEHSSPHAPREASGFNADLSRSEAATLPTTNVAFTGFGIAVAGYPEKHVEAPDAATDLVNLKRKATAGADAIITQLFYENANFFRFVESARAIGIAQPIVPGLLPILSVRQIRRITSMCGSAIPPVLQTQLEAAGDDDSAAEEIGVRQCVNQASELLERGVPGIHFYVLNKSSHMRRIMDQLPAGRP